MKRPVQILALALVLIAWGVSVCWFFQKLGFER